MSIIKTSLFLLLCFASSFSIAAEKPNIVLVFLDNFGWGEPGFNGGGIVRGAELRASMANPAADLYPAMYSSISARGITSSMSSNTPPQRSSTTPTSSSSARPRRCSARGSSTGFPRRSSSPTRIRWTRTATGSSASRDDFRRISARIFYLFTALMQTLFFLREALG